MLARSDVDRMYRRMAEHLAHGGDLWVTRPSYDTQPRRRRQAGELPGDVLDYITLSRALDEPYQRGGLTAMQRYAFLRVVMGMDRIWSEVRGEYVSVYVGQWTYERAAGYLEVTENAVKHAVRAARARLALLLSDDGDGHE